MRDVYKRQTLLIRPDPQIIWKNEEVSPLWARADAIYYRSAKGGGQWEMCIRDSCIAAGTTAHTVTPVGCT